MDKNLFLQRQNSNSSNLSDYSADSPRIKRTTVRKNITKHSGSLEFIEGDASSLCNSGRDCLSRDSTFSDDPQRPWSRGTTGSVPPRADASRIPSAGRKVNTPTKQISLQAVRRKEESSEPFIDHVDWRPLNSSHGPKKAWLDQKDEDVSSPLQSFNPGTNRNNVPPTDHTARSSRYPTSHDTERAMGNLSISRPEHLAGREKRPEDREREEKEKDEVDVSDSESDDSSDDEEEAEELKAPNELLMEFVDCLMKKDFKNADKLCKMVLLYEPGNAEALKFQPLIEEKLRLDAEAAAEREREEAEGGEDDDDDDDDDDDEDDDDDDDDDTSSEDSDDDDDDDDEDDDEEEVVDDPNIFARPDSGISV